MMYSVHYSVQLQNSKFTMSQLMECFQLHAEPIQMVLESPTDPYFIPTVAEPHS